MTDLPPKPPASSRGLRLALAISVALNLAVAGVVGGAMLRADGPRSDAMPRDLGFGFFGEALTPENRTDLRQRLRAESPGFLRERRAMADDLRAIVTALRADPFDAAALDQAMQAQVARLRTRLDFGQDLLLDFLTDLSPTERQAIADRLEASAERRPPKRDPQAGN